MVLQHEVVDIAAACEGAIAAAAHLTGVWIVCGYLLNFALDKHHFAAWNISTHSGLRFCSNTKQQLSQQILAICCGDATPQPWQAVVAQTLEMVHASVIIVICVQAKVVVGQAIDHGANYAFNINTTSSNDIASARQSIPFARLVMQWASWPHNAHSLAAPTVCSSSTASSTAWSTPRRCPSFQNCADTGRDHTACIRSLFRGEAHIGRYSYCFSRRLKSRLKQQSLLDPAKA